LRSFLRRWHIFGIHDTKRKQTKQNKQTDTKTKQTSQQLKSSQVPLHLVVVRLSVVFISFQVFQLD
jgi:hypothetical protein